MGKKEDKNLENQRVLTVGYPVFSLAFTTKHRLFIGGGGGANRSGVKNVISLYVLNQKTLETNQAMEHILPQDEDSIMSLDLHPKSKFVICGKNGTNEQILQGLNKSLKIYRITRTNSDIMSVTSSDSLDMYNHSSLNSSSNSLPLHEKNDYKLEYCKSACAMLSKNVSDYQKITEFDHEGRHILTGATDGTLNVFDLTLRPLFSKSFKTEVIDAHFNTTDDQVVAVTTKAVYILNSSDGSVIHEISNKSIPSSEVCNFRASRYGTAMSEGILFVIANSLKRNATFVCKYNTKDWKLIKCKQIHNKPITSFAISPDGLRLGYGTADLTIGVLNINSMKTIMVVKDAHGLPCTCVQFTKDSSIIVSGSADGTCRISRIIEKKSSNSAIYIILLSIIVAVISIAYAAGPEKINEFVKQNEQLLRNMFQGNGTYYVDEENYTSEIISPLTETIESTIPTSMADFTETPNIIDAMEEITENVNNEFINNETTNNLENNNEEEELNEVINNDELNNNNNNAGEKINEAINNNELNEQKDESPENIINEEEIKEEVKEEINNEEPKEQKEELPENNVTEEEEVKEEEVSEEINNEESKEQEEKLPGNNVTEEEEVKEEEVSEEINNEEPKEQNNEKPENIVIEEEVKEEENNEINNETNEQNVNEPEEEVKEEENNEINNESNEQNVNEPEEEVVTVYVATVYTDIDNEENQTIKESKTQSISEPEKEQITEPAIETVVEYTSETPSPSTIPSEPKPESVTFKPKTIPSQPPKQGNATLKPKYIPSKAKNIPPKFPPKQIKPEMNNDESNSSNSEEPINTNDMRKEEL